MLFNDRASAGILLAQNLSFYRGSESIVLGLSRGGVVVASKIAEQLGLLFDVLVVKKISSPTNSELAIGAVAPDGVSFVDQVFARTVGADNHYIRTQNSELNDQVKRKTLLYKKNRKPLSVKGKTVIVVDDGAATGATMQAAVMWLEKKNAKKIVIALPVAPEPFIHTIKKGNVELVVLETLSDFRTVGECYGNFPQVTDEEVIQLLYSESSACLPARQVVSRQSSACLPARQVVSLIAED